MSGFVSFVSSGPGDPELLTLRAVDRLAKAEVVLFDDLSSGPVLSHANPGAELVSVGKRAGRPSAKQDHVNRLLIDYASDGAKVVRLKSGDCSIFGRLEEEIATLRSAGIAFEIVPGVTSATAAAAVAGIPLTRRLNARRVQFITGSDVTGGLPTALNMPAIADPTATTVVYMGKRTFARLGALLIEHGLPASTPALLAEAVTTPNQTVSRSTIGTLTKALEGATSNYPTLIFYGPLVEE